MYVLDGSPRPGREETSSAFTRQLLPHSFPSHHPPPTCPVLPYGPHRGTFGPSLWRVKWMVGWVRPVENIAGWPGSCFISSFFVRHGVFWDRKELRRGSYLAFPLLVGVERRSRGFMGDRDHPGPGVTRGGRHALYIPRTSRPLRSSSYIYQPSITINERTPLG